MDKKRELQRIFDEQRNNWDRVFVISVVVAVFGALAWIRMYARPVAGPPIREEQASQASIGIDTRDKGAREAAAVPTIPHDAIAVVYECEDEGRRVLTDQPCGPGATLRAIREPNRMQAQDTSRLYEPVYPRSPPRRSSAGESWNDSDVAWRCARIQTEIDRINTRMRQGYRNGEHLRQRLRELSAERWDIECRFLKTPRHLRN